MYSHRCPQSPRSASVSLFRRRLQRNREPGGGGGTENPAAVWTTAAFVVREIGGGSVSRMVCPTCFSHCEIHNVQGFAIFVRDDSKETANIPCNARNRFNEMSRLKFKADGSRYLVEVYRGFDTTLIGGDDWAKFKRDFNMGQGKVVVFEMSGRTTTVHVCIVGSGLAAEYGWTDDDLDEDEDEEEGGGAEGYLAGDEEEEEIVADHGIEDAPDFECTRGFVFTIDEFELMEQIFHIQDGYVGPHFVHRLTPTNGIGKLMKIPRKLVQPLNFDPEGVVGLCMGAGDVMEVSYHLDRDGRMVLNREWGSFVAQNQLQVDEAVVFDFRVTNAENINYVCVFNLLRPDGP